jgi:predicted  nucleic acid-binding Zn-ribbon protein
MDRDKLLKEIQAIESNLSYYKRDLKKSYTKLKTEFDISPDDVQNRIKEISTRQEELDSKEEILEEEIAQKLKRIKHGRRHSRI